MFALQVQIEAVMVAFAPVFSQPFWHHTKRLGKPSASNGRYLSNASLN
jgi:hypothetical protein